MENNNSTYVIIPAFQDAKITEQYDFCAGDYIACADGGYNFAASCGIRPDVVIGDFDSCTAGVDDLTNLGISAHMSSPEKDDTDTLLCAKHAIAEGFERIVIVGGLGGSFDHTFANLQVLSFLADMEVSAQIVTARETVLMLAGDSVKIGPGACEIGKDAELVITGKEGQIFSVFSYEERSSGVFIEGAKYELNNAVLTHSYPIGVRNEFTSSGQVTIKVGFGRLLIVISK